MSLQVAREAGEDLWTGGFVWQLTEATAALSHHSEEKVPKAMPLNVKLGLCQSGEKPSETIVGAESLYVQWMTSR